MTLRSMFMMGLLAGATVLTEQKAFAQFGPPAWAGSTLRGRYHYYNGPHVNFGSGRWGGGISNNGALVLNTLTQTAGAVAPVIVPLFAPGAGVVPPAIAPSANTPAANNGEGGNFQTESQTIDTPLDVNREQRDTVLQALETRSEDLLKAWRITKKSPATEPSEDESSGEVLEQEGQLPPKKD